MIKHARKILANQDTYYIICSLQYARTFQNIDLSPHGAALHECLDRMQYRNFGGSAELIIFRGSEFSHAKSL